MSEPTAVVFIPLTQGKVAVIDFEDFEKVRGTKWHAARRARRWYAMRRGPRSPICKSGPMFLLHRVLTGAPAGLEVDHEDGDGLNNRRFNLRVCTVGQNRRAFRRKVVGATSRFRGVSHRQDTHAWTARLNTGEKCFNLGCFTLQEDAARAYDKKAQELFGEFAQLNFPVGKEAV